MKEMAIMKKCMCFLIVLISMLFTSSLSAAPLELEWDLSKEQRNDVDDKGRYKVYTVPEGWQLEVTENNFQVRQGFKLPSKARYLFRYETEAEILSLEGRAKTGIYMGKEGVALVLEISGTETQLRFSHGGKVSFITKGRLPQKLVPPAKIMMVYDVDTGEVAGFINGAPAVSGNTKKLPNLPGLTSITSTGVMVGTMWDSSSAKGVYKSIRFNGK